MAATIPTIDEVRAAVHEEVDALRRELLAALNAAAGEQPLTVADAARIGVRLSAAALSALGERPAERAREVLEAWARAQR